jgi:hypothetical protein
MKNPVDKRKPVDEAFQRYFLLKNVAGPGKWSSWMPSPLFYGEAFRLAAPPRSSSALLKRRE